MASQPVGKREFVDIRKVWPDEARDFTPWLASGDGLELLGEAINEELELVGTETNVGPFSADLLARVVGEEEHYIVVENQFGKTDHDHLGKIITYASGLKAKTVVWIAETFTDEHRQAIDWLNESKGEKAMFFAMEIVVIRIGDSLPAPELKLVSSPNIWAQAVQESAGSEPTTLKLDQQRFWEDVRDYFKSHKTLLPTRKPRPQQWYDIAIGRANFNLALTLNSRLERIGCELYMSGPQAKQAFDELSLQKTEIQKELGHDLEWQRLEGREACRIALYRKGSIYNAEQRDDLKAWLLDTATRFHQAFAARVKALQLSQDAE